MPSEDSIQQFADPAESPEPTPAGEEEATAEGSAELEQLQKRGLADPAQIAKSYVELERKFTQASQRLRDREVELGAVLRYGQAQRQPAAPPPPRDPNASLEELGRDPDGFVASRADAVVEARLTQRLAEQSFKNALLDIKADLSAQFEDEGEVFEMLLPMAKDIAIRNPGLEALGPKDAARRVFDMAIEKYRKAIQSSAKLLGPGTQGKPQEGQKPTIPTPGSSRGTRTAIPGSKPASAAEQAKYKEALSKGDSVTVARMLMENHALGGLANRTRGE